MQTEHGVKCGCGKLFQNPEKVVDHVAVRRVLDEVKRIGGERFHEVAENFENDAHSGDIRELAENQDLELRPENATAIAKKEIIHIVRHHDQLLGGEH